MKQRGWVASLSLVCGLVWAVSCSSDDGGPTGGHATGGMGGTDPGHGGAGGDVSEDLELVSRSPEANDENAWALAPIQLEFSTALDEETLDAAVRLQVGGAEVPHSFELDDSGKRLTITLDAVPALPAKVSLSVTSELESKGGAAFAGDAWSFSYPLWQSPSGALPAAAGDAEGLALGVLPGRAVVAVTAREDGSLQAARHDDGTWVELSAPPVVSEAAVPVEGAVDSDGNFVLLWLEGEGADQSVYAARLDGDEWTLLGDGSVFSGAASIPALALDGVTPVVAARDAAGALVVRRLGADGWEDAGTAYTDSSGSAGANASVRELDLTLDESGEPVVVVVDEAFDLVVARWQGAQWSSLGKIDRARAAGSAEPSLVWSGGPILAYLDGDEVSTNVQVARRTTAWVPFGAALDVEVDAQASAPELALDPNGAPVVLWRERWGESDRVLAARASGEAWQVLGAALGTELSDDARSLRLAFDDDGNVNAGWLSGSDENALSVHRFNGSPALPHGLQSLGDRGDCALPEDTDASFPTTLSATGCYEDLRSRALVGAAIPFSINSPLWSDGALKKRYLLLPEGGTVDYVSEGPLGMPVGTIIIKEFYVEKTQGDPSSAIPVETRFLVKRLADDMDAASWQGYSYQWNSAGTDGALLDGDAPLTVDWPVATNNGSAATHTHSYPSRAQCTQCHNQAGRVLGLQSAQLNRAQDYGDVIDNQLRAWITAGLFGTTSPEKPAEALTRLVSPPDVGRSLEERSRAYFHSNCSHCHRPGATVTPKNIDFRYFAPLASDNICNHIVKGDHTLSQIYLNDSHRGDPVDVTKQMPPIATLKRDDRQLAVTAAWIDLNNSCP